MAGKVFFDYISYMETYRGRDKFIRATSYLACLVGGKLQAKNPSLAGKCFIVVNELNACRTVLRLFDDSAMLGYCLHYSFKKQEKDKLQRVLNLIMNIINQVFYPLVHAAWAADKKLISISSAPWWTASLLAWVVSLTLSVLISLRQLHRIRSSNHEWVAFNVWFQQHVWFQ